MSAHRAPCPAPPARFRAPFSFFFAYSTRWGLGKWGFHPASLFPISDGPRRPQLAIFPSLENGQNFSSARYAPTDQFIAAVATGSQIRNAAWRMRHLRQRSLPRGPPKPTARLETAEIVSSCGRLGSNRAAFCIGSLTGVIDGPCLLLINIKDW